MTQDEARAKLAEFRVLIDDVDRRIVVAAQRTDARGRGDRPREGAGQPADLRAQARRPGVRQCHRVATTVR